MEAFTLFAGGLATALVPKHLFAMAVGVTYGIVVGTLPGLTAVLGLALAIPFVISMDPAMGLMVLGAIFSGAIYGGANSAILIKTPGTPSAIATVFDGYPMTQQGKADQALVIALLASVFGGIFSTAVLLVAFAPLARFSLQFGPAEYFWLAILGTTTIASLASDNLLKGLLGGAIGVMLGIIGLDPISSMDRLTFGFSELSGGIDLIAAILGFMSFSQILVLFERRDRFIAEFKESPGYVMAAARQCAAKLGMLVRSSAIGTVVGILPGAGGPIASLLAYNESRRVSKHPETFGTGNPEGLITSESANNATVGGALIPTMALGIPGDPAAAVMLGGLFAFGLQPGIRLLENSGDVAYAFIASLFVANILMLFIGLFVLRLTGRILRIPRPYVATTVAVLSVIGTYSVNSSLFDVGVMIVCGAAGYLFQRAGIHPGPIVLGLILGPIGEDGFTQALTIAQATGNYGGMFFGHGLTWVLLALIVLALTTPLFIHKRGEPSAAEVAGGEEP